MVIARLVSERRMLLTCHARAKTCNQHLFSNLIDPGTKELYHEGSDGTEFTIKTGYMVIVLAWQCFIRVAYRLNFEPGLEMPKLTGRGANIQ